VGVQVIDDGVDPLDLGGDPRLDPTEEVGPVGGAATGIGMRQGRAGRRAERPEDLALAAPAVVDLWLGPPGGSVPPLGVGPRRGADELLPREALGRLRPPRVQAGDDAALRGRRIEPPDDPLFSAKAGSTRSPNPVS
jgi:hypothetical protein